MISVYAMAIYTEQLPYAVVTRAAVRCSSFTTNRHTFVQHMLLSSTLSINRQHDLHIMICVLGTWLFGSVLAEDCL